MTEVPEIHRVLREQLDNPDSSFSIGSIGAIAEFHRDVDEPLLLDDSEQLTIATERGALKIVLTDSVVPVAYETLSRQPSRWQHGLGRDKPFETSSLARFRSLLELWGSPEYCAEKARAVHAIQHGLDAGAYDYPQTRLGRTALRVALRQLRQSDTDNPILDEWSSHFDSALAESDGDRAADEPHDQRLD